MVDFLLDRILVSVSDFFHPLQDFLLSFVNFLGFFGSRCFLLFLLCRNFLLSGSLSRCLSSRFLSGSICNGFLGRSFLHGRCLSNWFLSRSLLLGGSLCYRLLGGSFLLGGFFRRNVFNFRSCLIYNFLYLCFFCLSLFKGIL